MEKQTELYKGELMEEKLRHYFLNNGYYVARGIEYKFEGDLITDIDLFLYGRTSSLTRERVNVDIKNKKTPKAFERILWAKGLQQLLSFENCVVATSEKKPSIRKYGLQNDTIILDGNFLQKLPYNATIRITEDGFLTKLGAIKSYTEYKNQTWRALYERSKSSLLTEMDFSGYNSTLLLLKYFLLKCFDKQKTILALRVSYVVLSHTLLILDYILRNIAFLEPKLRQEALYNGFQYGNLGKEGLDRTIDLAVKIAKSRIPINVIKKSLDSNQNIDILSDYFSKPETTKNIFKWARLFEQCAFNNTITKPKDLDLELKSSLAIMLDYFDINRKDFFDLYQ